MNNILDHSRFEELCALSAIGQITPVEYKTLSLHMRQCTDCRETYSDMSGLTHSQLPQVATESVDAPKPTGVFAAIADNGYKARFAARAKEYGIEVSRPERSRLAVQSLASPLEKLRFSYQLAFVVAIVVLLFAVGSLFHQLKEAHQHEAAMSARLSDLSVRNADLRHQASQLVDGKRNAEDDLIRTNLTTKELEARLGEAELQLAGANRAIQNLQIAVEESKNRTTQTQLELASAEQSLVAIKDQFAKFRLSHAGDEGDRIARQVELADLSHRIKEQQEVIDKQQRLLSVDTDVRNLMAARSLHITDVFDIDGKGKKKSAFGRVFYTEGKSLVFYAFDLDGPKLPSGKHSFQAWAQLASSTTSTVSLGIFYVDDPTQKRWMLKFDNPEILEQISAVFVTAEPHGGTARPTGQKLMYAYLGHDPNHP